DHRAEQNGGSSVLLSGFPNVHSHLAIEGPTTVPQSLRSCGGGPSFDRATRPPQGAAPREQNCQGKFETGPRGRGPFVTLRDENPRCLWLITARMPVHK